MHGKAEKGGHLSEHHAQLAFILGRCRLPPQVANLISFARIYWPG